MAAPVEIEDANWHRSQQLHKECGWKRGDSAIANLGKDAPKAAVDFAGLLMEVANHSSRNVVPNNETSNSDVRRKGQSPAAHLHPSKFRVRSAGSISWAACS